MKTEEAIKWVFDVWHEWENVYGCDAEANLKEGKKMDEVTKLLKEGEENKQELDKLIKKYVEREAELLLIIKKTRKYRQIVEYLEKNCGYFYYGSADNLNSIIPRLKQKYFPEEVLKKDVTIEIESENIEDMANALKDIGHFVNCTGVSKMKVIGIGEFKKDCPDNFTKKVMEKIREGAKKIKP